MSSVLTCQKCKGTGNSGFLSSTRCTTCSGTGEIKLIDANHEAMFEIVESLLENDNFDEKWTLTQLKKIKEIRKNKP